MPLQELDINAKTPENLTGEEDDLELIFKDDDFDPNLGLDDDDDTEDFEEEEDEEEELEDELEEEIEEDEEEEEPKSKRENDRIRTLIEERNAERERTRQAKEESLALQKQMIEMQKSTVESTKGVLKNHVESLKSQMKTAHENDDSDVYVELQSQLTKAQTDLAALESWEPAEIPETTPENTQKDAPESFTRWEIKNSWFKNPKSRNDILRRDEAIAYSNMLAAKGINIETDEFFDLIDERLETLGLANDDTTNVKSKKKSSKRRKKSKISQRVQGASRTPSSRKNSKKKTIEIDSDVMALIDVMGITPEEYAKEMVRVEESKKTGSRMTTLKLD